MKVVTLAELKKNLPKYLVLAKREEIVVTDGGHAAFLWQPITDEDLEDHLRERDPRFAARMEASRSDYARHGGTPLEDMAKELGIKLPRRQAKENR